MSMIRYPGKGRPMFGGAGMISARNPKPIPNISGNMAADLIVAGLEAATFTRSTTATFTDYEGVLRTAAINEPRFEGGRRISEGVWSNVKPDGSPIYPAPKLLMEGQSRNKVTSKTANPVDLTGVTKSGDAAATLAVVDDAAALAAAGLSAICSSGKVYEIDNTGGVTGAYCTFATNVANTNIHSLSCYIRVVTGTSGRIEFNNGTLLSSTTSAVYSRVKLENKTPVDVNQKLAVYATAGSKIRFILPVLEELPVCTSVIPNDTGSPLTRTADACSWPLSAELQAMLSIDKAWTTSLANQTGLTWGAEKNQSSFADGQSWFDHPDKDLSAYANSGKMMILRDSAGRLAWGFIGGAGTGQTFGSELVTNGGFDSWTGDNPNNWTINGIEDVDEYVTKDNGKARIHSAGTDGFGIQQIISNTAKKQYKLSYDISVLLNGFQEYLKVDTTILVNYVSILTSGTFARNIVGTGGAGFTVRFYRFYGRESNFTVDNVSLKEVLTPSTKGVYIYKDAARTQQGWNMEASFNMNDTTYAFDVVDDTSIEGTVVLGLNSALFPLTNHGFLSVGITYTAGLYTSTLSQLKGYDGSLTNILTSPAMLSSTDYVIGLRWSIVTRTYEVIIYKNGAVYKNSQVFDGKFEMATVLSLHLSNTVPAKYSNLCFYRRWLTDAELRRL